MEKIRIIMHAFADVNDVNAQNLNAREIALRLNPDKFDISLFYRIKQDPRLINKKNIEVIKVPNIKAIPFGLILKKLLDKKYDVFFYVRNFYLDYLYFRLKNIVGDKKITIYTVENALPYPLSKRYNKIAKENVLKSDYVFSVSKYVAETVEREYSIKTPAIYVGVDTNTFVPNEILRNGQKTQILYVGSFQERKRPYLILEAAKQFPDVDFILIGRGPLKEKLYNLKNKYYINNVKIITRTLSTDELIRYYQKSDIFLFPSIHEGFPKVTLEAASCGLPAIVFNNYKPETVLDNKTGFIVKDFQEMLDKLEILIEDPDLRLKMGKNAREYAKNFDWDIIVRKWEKIFIGAVGNDG